MELPRAAPQQAEPSAASAAAYEAYLQGLYLVRQATPQSLQRAAELFERAVLEDPGYAQAHALLARASLQLWAFHGPSHEPWAQRARQAAATAVALRPDLAETHIARAAAAALYEWDWPEAERSLLRALDLAPQSPDAHHHYAWLLLRLARWDEALAEMQQAQRLDPLSVGVASDLGWFYYRSRRYAEAARQCYSTLELDAQSASALECRHQALAQMGRHAEALQQARQAMEAAGATARELALLDGPAEAAYARFRRWLIARMRAQGADPYYLAAQHAALGEPDQAFQELELAHQRRSALLGLLLAAPELDPYAADPRYRDLVRRLGLPQGRP
jgi:tetratricopeptide (TPR) repeat protein